MENLENLKGKNWVATMMLSLSFGMLGGHRFYSGKTGSAWAILLCTFPGCFLCGIPTLVSGVWVAVDILTIAFGKWKHADGSELYERIDWLGYTIAALFILTILTYIVYFAIVGVAGMASLAGMGGSGN
jgi:TM2 domain-containing membrane protein YozV